MRWLYFGSLVLIACSTHHGGPDSGTGDPPSGPPPCNGSCSASQYCDGTSCQDAVLQNACIAAKATVVLDGYDADDRAAHDLGHGMNGCNPNMMIRYITATDVKGVLASDGRPITGPGDLLITTGGGFTQPSVRFMETKLTPIFSQSSENGARIQVIERSSGSPLVDVAVSALTATHDDFVLQLAAEPASGTFTLMSYGLYAAGTAAGVWYAANVMIPKKDMYGDRWYLFEWQDTDGMAGPTMGDMFMKLASGK